MKRNRLNEMDLSRIVRRVINEDKEEKEMEDRGMSLTVKDIFEEVVNALNELGEYDDSMEREAMRLAEDIMYRMQDELAYISENYENELYEILGENF
jgi:predicted nucleic acid-binding protein